MNLKKKYCCPSCDSPVKEGDCTDCLVDVPTEIVLKFEEGRWNVEANTRDGYIASSRMPVKALKKFLKLFKWGSNEKN